MTPRQRARVDGNQDEIVEALERLDGVSIAKLSDQGNGIPDLIVGWDGGNLLLEVKDEHQPPSKQRLTPAQIRFHGRWKGTLAIVNSVETAVDAVRSEIGRVK